jgi:predicted nucleotidyltransferase
MGFARKLRRQGINDGSEKKKVRRIIIKRLKAQTGYNKKGAKRAPFELHQRQKIHYDFGAIEYAVARDGIPL